MIRKTFSALAAAMLFCSSACAEEVPQLDQAFRLIDRIVSNDVAFDFPSAQIAVMKGGKLLYENAWGEGITADTLFDLASNTKAYSVVYAAQYLVSRGLLDLDAPIAALAGDAFAQDVLDIAYPQADAERTDLETQRQWKRQITVRDVLCHRAGLPAEANFLFLSDYAFDGCDGNPLYAGCSADESARAGVLSALCRMPLYYAPGTRVLYSDTDFVLLSLLIEKITGMRLDDFLRQNFWEPLGLRHITYNPLENGFTAADCAPTELCGNTRDGTVYFDGIRTETIRGQVHDETAYYAMAGVSGNAGLFADARDLAILADLMTHSTGFFTDEVRAAFTAPASAEHDEWGIGWYRQGDLKRSNYFSTLSGENTIGHQGWTGTLTVIDAEEELVIVVLTSKRNTPVTDPAVNPNAFDGNNYTTAKLGFASQLIYQALHGLPLDDVLQSLVDAMDKQYETAPCTAAERALASIRQTQAEWLQGN